MKNTIVNKMTKSEVMNWLKNMKALQTNRVNNIDEKKSTLTVYFSDGSTYKVTHTYNRSSLVFNCFNQEVISYRINGELVHTEII